MKSVRCLLFLSIIVIASYPNFSQAALQDRVLIIVNRNSSVSMKIGAYYSQARNIPNKNIVEIDSTDEEEISREAYNVDIKIPIARYLTKHGLHDRILYVVTTKGIPLKIKGNGKTLKSTRASVDSELSLLYRETILGEYSTRGRVPNPLFKVVATKDIESTFDHDLYDIYLVTRLTGYRWEEIKRIIDQARQGSTSGVFVFDAGSSNTGLGDEWLGKAGIPLLERGFAVIRNEKNEPLYDIADVLGYGGWGSNDGNRSGRYLGFRWKPGALATTFVSTNGRTFKDPGPSWVFTQKRGKDTVGSGQSLSADMIREGATGVSANVYEPYLDGCVRPDILFDRYTRGFNLAESFYGALPYLSWQSVIVGDPLCSPYADLEAPVPIESKRGWFEDRTLNFSKSLRHTYDDRKAFMVLARIALNVGDSEKALELLEKVVAIAPEWSRPYILIAGIYGNRGEREKAVDIYRNLLHDHEDPEVMNNLAWLYAESTHQLEEAFYWAGKAHSLLPDSPEVNDTLGWILLKRGDAKKALAYFEKAVESFPENAVMRSHLGEAYLVLGEKTNARHQFKKALQTGGPFSLIRRVRKMLEHSEKN